MRTTICTCTAVLISVAGFTAVRADMRQAAAQATTQTAAPSEAPAQAAPDVTDKYVWADGCRDCHKEIYESWQKTKHARAIDRLSGAEQEQDCIGCHVTGVPRKVVKDGKVVNLNVQCEACHGPGAAHAANPTQKGAIAKVPRSEVCEHCHNAKSPRFRGFVYQGMSKLSHAVPK